MRFYTSGESHGQGLSVFIDGIPAGLEVDEDFVNQQLARRQMGYGRGGRMSIERDTIKVLTGIRFGKTTGAPISLWIENRDFKNWETIMATSGTRTEEADQKAFHRPRPGHADLAGYYKYGHQDLRDVLERASARETAARVAAGGIAQLLLRSLSIHIYSHVLVLGGIAVSMEELPESHEAIQERAESNEFRCAGSDDTMAKMKARVDEALKEGVTLGGRIEVVATGVPPGLGSYTQWDQKLDGELARAIMSIPAVKSVSIGAGELGDRLTGYEFHDEIVMKEGALTRPTNRAGGLEGGVTNGMPVVAHAVMKPISTMRKALQSVNLQTGEQEQAHFERSDVTAVPACGVVCEAMMAVVLAQALLRKYGGDSVEELKAHYRASQDLINQHVH
jgi:chorismate synthase